jgi:hypothetical protein
MVNWQVSFNIVPLVQPYRVQSLNKTVYRDYPFNTVSKEISIIQYLEYPTTLCPHSEYVQPAEHNREYPYTRRALCTCTYPVGGGREPERASPDSASSRSSGLPLGPGIVS